jgi:signal transduction histidine kinase
VVVDDADFDHVSASLSMCAQRAIVAQTCTEMAYPSGDDYFGILGLRGRQRMTRTGSFGLPKPLLGWACALLAACVLIGVSEAGHRRSAAALAAMDEQVQVRAALNSLLQLMLDAESGARGFLLTGDARELVPYRQAREALPPLLERLRAAHAPLPVEAPAWAELAQHAQEQLAALDQSVRLRQQGRSDAWALVPAADPARSHMQAIRARTGQLVAATGRRIDAAEAEVRRALRLARGGIALVAVAALLAFGLSLRRGQALARAGERQQQALERERDRLEQLVRERTASLERLATHLQQVREDERGHLARELHDDLGALLTAAKLDVARLKSRLGPQASETADRLQHLSGTLDSGIALKRRIIEDLRPSTLDSLGLTAALEILAREVGEHAGLAVRTALEPVELEPGHQLTAFRLVQESLTNSVRHGEARIAEVVLRRHGTQVEVAVRDDGRGFDPAQVRPGTHGLAGMRHRIEAAGGRLQVESAPGGGTRVAAWLPARGPAPASA